MPTVEELGKRVKAKYPGQYDDLPDTQVGQKVKAKFPGDYDDFADAPEALKTWSDKLGLNKPESSEFFDAAPIVDAAEGAVSGLAKTVFRGGDVIRRLTGQERIIDKPEVQQAMRAPDTLAGKAGELVENVAEFAVPLSKLSKATAAMPILKRIGAEAAGGAGVAAVQSGGDPATIAAGAVGGAALPIAGAVFRGGKEVVRRTVAGAEEGGMGGAAARFFRGVVPQDARATMTQALKPRSSRVNFDRSLSQALPELKATEATMGRPIRNLSDLTEGLAIAKKRVWGELEAIVSPGREMGITGNLSPVADAIEQSITKKMRLENHEKVKAIMDTAAKYRKDFSLADIEDLLHETNAELAPFYSKFPADQARVLQSGANPAQLEFQARALRKTLDDVLDRSTEGTGPAAKELRRHWGSLREVEEEAIRRKNVTARQQPENLSEQMAGWSGFGDVAKGGYKVGRGILTASPATVIEGASDIVGGYAKRAGAKFIKEQQTTDALIRRAMESITEHPLATPTPKRTPIAGLLEAGPTRMGSGPDPSGVTVTKAKSAVARDPQTGRMKRVYTSESQIPEGISPAELAKYPAKQVAEYLKRKRP